MMVSVVTHVLTLSVEAITVLFHRSDTKAEEAKAGYPVAQMDLSRQQLQVLLQTTNYWSISASYPGPFFLRQTET